jgi:hypothetical protein
MNNKQYALVILLSLTAFLLTNASEDDNRYAKTEAWELILKLADDSKPLDIHNIIPVYYQTDEMYEATSSKGSTIYVWRDQTKFNYSINVGTGPKVFSDKAFAEKAHALFERIKMMYTQQGKEGKSK